MTKHILTGEENRFSITSFSVKALLRRSSRSEGFDTPSATQPDGDVSRPSVSLENAAHWVSILISIRLRLLNPSRYSAGLSSRRHIEINRRSLTEKLVLAFLYFLREIPWLDQGYQISSASARIFHQFVLLRVIQPSALKEY
jgi:hypothetical protein